MLTVLNALTQLLLFLVKTNCTYAALQELQITRKSWFSGTPEWCWQWAEHHPVITDQHNTQLCLHNCVCAFEFPCFEFIYSLFSVLGGWVFVFAAWVRLKNAQPNPKPQQGSHGTQMRLSREGYLIAHFSFYCTSVAKCLEMFGKKDDGFPWPAACVAAWWLCLERKTRIIMLSQGSTRSEKEKRKNPQSQIPLWCWPGCNISTISSELDFKQQF